MQITINGEAHELPSPMTLQELLRHLELKEERVAIERNREIVKREQWGSVRVEAGDQLEIVHLVGGGSDLFPPCTVGGRRSTPTVDSG